MPDGSRSSPDEGYSSNSGISGSEYAKRTRKLIRLIKDLRALGAEADFDLPRIAVIGNQSAGKSSLVEAISGITVPRASGTCTRCPMECRLTYDENGPWRCQVLLRRSTDADGNKVQTKEEPFGPLLHDKSELEEMLRRAQLAILNPSLPAESLVDFDTSTLKPGEAPLGSERQLQFSNNVVCLDLAGPDVIDLSFIDLPGIISNVAAGDDRSNIEAVQKMVKRHIKGNTLILLTITMRDDIDNQGAAHLARIEDEDGLRTIGVLTKPDLIQQGEEDGWLQILDGSKHRLNHGYFMTKQPSQKELQDKISFTTAREREVAFFDNTWPWNAHSELKHRMGTPNLTKELSKLLGNVINKALPELRRDSKNSYSEVERLMNALPPPPSDDPAAELLRMVTSFNHDVGGLIQGRESFGHLIQRCRPAYAKLRRDIRGTAPRFLPFASNEDTHGFSPDFNVESVSGEEPENTEEGERSEVMNLDAVRNHIERSLTRELPFNVPFSAKVSLIRRFHENWDDHCLRCFDDVNMASTEELKKLVKSYFGEYGSLLDHVESEVEELLERQRKNTCERIRWMLELESPPFTNNNHYFASYREKYLRKYKEARQPLAESDQANHIQSLMDSLRGLGRDDVQREKVTKMLQDTDAYEEQLIVMAETSAYFHVAYKRIIDNIPRIIDHDFLRAIARDMQKTLISGLGLAGDNASQTAEAYLAEDEAVAARRSSLQQKKIRLKGVMDKLYRFGA